MRNGDGHTSLSHKSLIPKSWYRVSQIPEHNICSKCVRFPWGPRGLAVSMSNIRNSTREMSLASQTQELPRGRRQDKALTRKLGPSVRDSVVTFPCFVPFKFSMRKAQSSDPFTYRPR